MRDEAAFLAAIRDAPADAAVRLVYADWLEEHGDARGELVRVEEEMRGLPAYSDRFWQLKTRRNELRAQAPSEWLQAMRYGTDCLPVFAHGIPEGWRERWRLIREFVERWHRRPLGDVGGRAGEIREAEGRLGRALPPSLGEWVAFAHDIRTSDVLRDGYHEMSDLPGHAAVSLLLQAEGDYHWAVRHEDFALPDPPVYGFGWNVESGDENSFVPDDRNPVAGSVSEFAFGYAMGYTHGTGGAFGSWVADPADLSRELHAAFEARSRLGETEFFEAENILVRLGPSPVGRGPDLWLEVKVAKALPRDAIPAFLWEYTGRGYRSGLFIPEELRQPPPPQYGGAGEGDEVPF